MPLGTNALPATRAPDRTIARWSTTEFDPTRAPSSTMQHSRCDEVPDHAVVADDRGELRGAVHDRAVLDRRARADLDVAVVTAEHRLRPDRGVGADRDVADDRRVGVHECVGMDRRRDVTERVDGHERDGSLRRDARRRPTRRRDRARRLHRRRGCDRARADRRALRRSASARGDLRDLAGRQLLRGLAHGPHLQPARPRQGLRARSRCTTSVLPIVERVLDRGCLVSSLSSIAIQPGETAQPIHADDQLIPLAKPHAPTVCNTMWALTDFTEANGATRVVPGSHLADHSPDYGAPYDCVAGRDAEGQRARVARQPLARRRREHDRRAARRHRDELLRGVHPPAGEPAARHPARGRRRLLTAAARAVRLRHLPRSHRAHQQVRSGRDPRARAADGPCCSTRRTHPRLER